MAMIETIVIIRLNDDGDKNNDNEISELWRNFMNFSI